MKAKLRQSVRTDRWLASVLAPDGTTWLLLDCWFNDMQDGLNWLGLKGFIDIVVQR